MKTRYDVVIGGRSVAGLIDPVLQEIKVHDGTDNEADTASLVLDDTGGQTYMANSRDPVSIRLGQEGGALRTVFEGFVDEPRSRGSRDAGRTISIECKSVDLEGKAKEPVEKFWEDKDLQTILQDAMGLAGVSISVDASFAAIKREYEAMDGEDPLSFAARLAREVGATFKMMGPKAVFAARNTGLSVDGGALAPFLVAWGDNLISWDLSPIIPRAKFQKFAKRWFDFEQNKMMEEITEAAGKANLLWNAPETSQALAKETSAGEKAEAERKGGEGTITAIGSAVAQAGGDCILSGARPGIDGSYLIGSLDHSVLRASGWTVSLEVKRPSGGAGVDNR